MKTFFLSLFLYIFTAFHTIAQKTTYYDWKWQSCDISMARFISVVTQTDSGWLRSEIYIATKKLHREGLYKDSSCEIPNGWVRRYYTNGNLESEVRFTNGMTDGIYTAYHYNGMISDSMFYFKGVITGTLKRWHNNGFIADSVVYNKDGSAVQVSWFNNGMPSSGGKTTYGLQEGRWRYYHSNGNLASQEEYKAGKQVSRIYFDEDGMQLTDTSSRDRPALFRGSRGKWRRYVENNLQWPRNVKLVNTDTVTVMVMATIDEAGNVTNAYVEVPFHPLFDKEVLRVVKRSPKWTPAISHNRYVKDWLFEAVDFYMRPKKDKE
jgi:antitoxin component YwqK of YwqJK toxin-antitoxin module